MRRAEGLLASCSPRNAKIAPVLQQILDDAGRELACSELTLLEFHSNLTKNWRASELADCDQEWWERARADFLDRVATGRILVLPTPVRAIEQVMSLITMATRDLGRALRAWDALHAVVAARWAHEMDAPVEIITSDEDFDVVLDISGMGALVKIANLDVLASTGAGADRP